MIQCPKIVSFLRKITLNTILTVTGLILSLISLFAFHDKGNELVVIVFASYIIVLAILLAVREYTFSRKARYAEAMNDFHKCTHKLRDAFHEIGHSQDKDRPQEEIHKLLTNFANGFSLITGTKCRACIKITKIENDAVSVGDFCTETFARCTTKDLSKPTDELSRIKDNTDFSKIFIKGEKYYFCNDLSKENPYLNSNWPDDPVERQNFMKEKKFDYISAIVWPIRSKPNGSREKPMTIGFLCIDSLSRGVFSRRYDIDAGFLIADALYPFLLEYRQRLIHGREKPFKRLLNE